MGDILSRDILSHFVARRFVARRLAVVPFFQTLFATVLESWSGINDERAIFKQVFEPTGKLIA
jgi:hypothetical protein